MERHGRLIGFYIPVEPKEPDREARLREALRQLGAAVSRALKESGMSEEELAEYFDLSKPPPPSEARRRESPERAPRS
ncbi:hypothetical protein E0L93_02515 [Rubrobacter taiwanensis]|uniref:Uncharacterized protein n=1 Tax=Rubrobacter taiwanensis TaxID=185139 RepID=A0A4R1BQK6_9ACTN|nr:hypothetical protein [Rubrobacter taiwanensis]TCJ19848.1 hypothetical protein E0L93_02515 [Rubrobacter taiwanensis]